MVLVTTPYRPTGAGRAGLPRRKAGAGSYAVDPAGFVALDSPLRSGEKINARFSPEALLGSTTESPDTTFDLFAAIPAPAAGTAKASFTGSYWTANLEFPGGRAQRSALFSLTPSGAGSFGNVTVNGHALNLSAGQPVTQTVTGVTYAFAADGTGTASFGTASTSALLSGSKTIYVSQDGSVILGGSTAAGSHDILIGVKAGSTASTSSWSGRSWEAGLRVDPTAVTGYAGSVISVGAGFVWRSRRLKILAMGNLDDTESDTYTLNAHGSGSSESALIGLGAGGNAFVGSAVDPSDPLAFEVYFGAPMPKESGSGVYLDPQGVVNAASIAPAGNPIAPGEFISLFGAGLTSVTATASPPVYPPTLGGVMVLINNQPAPIYSVSAASQPNQLNVLVPYATQGPTATIQVQNNGVKSNVVTVPVAPTAPGLFSSDRSGTGLGAIRHADFSLVNPASPARPGETVLLFSREWALWIIP